MSDTEQERGAEEDEVEEEPIGGPISTEEAVNIAEEQGGSREELEAPEPQEVVKPKQSDELKVVIILNSGNVMLGVQSPDCDPVYTTLKGNLTAALKRVPKLVAEAKQKWSASPLNPKANLPEPKTSSTPARTPAPPKAQPSFF